jgi:DNA-binding response OmpR family regulator
MESDIEARTGARNDNMKTILNIQADEQVSYLMTWILSNSGFKVINVRAPSEAPDRTSPDVIIINTNMAVNEKRTCIAALRALVPNVHVIDLGTDAEDPSYETGADVYLAKPFSGDDLLARVRQAFAA